VDPRNRVLVGHSRWHHLANMAERLCMGLPPGGKGLPPAAKLFWAVLFYRNLYKTKHMSNTNVKSAIASLI